MGKLANLRHDIKMYWLSLRIQFKAAAELRAAFILQIVGMFINNTFFLLAWLFLFIQFGTINGWSGIELIGMQGIVMVVFGIVIVFSNGVVELPRYVDHGTFDTFLTKPSAILAQVASSRIEVAVIGDLLMGIILVVGYAIFVQVSLLSFLLFLAALAVGVTLMWCFSLLPYILAFYLFDSEKVAKNIHFFFLDSGLYPTGVLTGTLRTVMLVVFPGLMIGAVPLDALRGIGAEYVLLGAGVAAVWLWITLTVFKRAVRRYESANLVGAR